LGCFLDSYFPTFELFQYVSPINWRTVVTEQLVDEVEPLADGRVRNAEFLFDVADFSLATQEHEDEVLQVARQPEKKRDVELRIYLGIAAAAGQARNGQFIAAKRAARDELFGWAGGVFHLTIQLYS
jgi:hypothetical protein